MPSKQPVAQEPRTSSDRCFVLNPDASTHDLASGASIRAHQIRAISALAVSGNVDELRVDLQHAVIHAVQWIAADGEILMQELETRMTQGGRHG